MAALANGHYGVCCIGMSVVFPVALRSLPETPKVSNLISALHLTVRGVKAEILSGRVRQVFDGDIVRTRSALAECNIAAYSAQQRSQNSCYMLTRESGALP